MTSSAEGTGAVAVVTGATRGIGLALAEAMLKSGMTVYAVGVDPGRVADVALRLSDPTLQPAIEAARFQPLAMARDGDIFESQVDADRLLGCHARFGHLLHGHAQPPVPDRILCEATLAPFHIRQALNFEDAKRLTAEP